MSVKVLIAGCLPRDKGQIESEVRKALGDRTESGPWNVSLVKLGSSWSITLDGPEDPFRNLNLSAAEDGLHETITNALGSPAPKAAPPSLPELADPDIAEAVDDSGDRYNCSECGKAFKVIYTPEPQDRQAKAPVACPHCWQVNEVTVTESAAVTEEYRAETIPSG